VACLVWYGTQQKNNKQIKNLKKRLTLLTMAAQLSTGGHRLRIHDNNLNAMMLHKGHSISNQQEIVRSPDKTWCVCSTYGAHYPYKFLATYTS